MSDAADELRLPGQEALKELQQLTAARVALGRSGTSLRTQDHLAFQLDHASARDAVQMAIDIPSLAEKLRQRHGSVLLLQSAAGTPGRRTDRRTYLQRPDLGRRLSPESADTVRKAAAALTERPDVVLVVADGLSALAIERNTVPLLDAVQPLLATHQWKLGPLCLVRDGRVALGDEIGELLGATMLVMLIGERPGLSASDSMGLYLTWAPCVGRTDAERNCISNIRLGGLSHADAAERMLALMNKARASQRTGVELQSGSSVTLALPPMPHVLGNTVRYK